MGNLAVGYTGVALAVFFFGSNFIPIKRYETGDGMFFQFVVCCGIWVMGLVVAIARNNNVFNLFAMLGGAIWATGNLCTVPIVKCIGLARGLLVWGITNMTTGWLVSLNGWLGQRNARPDILYPALNYAGVALCATCVIISSFIKNTEEEKETIPKRVSSVGNLGSAVITTTQMDPEPLLPVTASETSWVDKLSSTQKNIVGYSLSIFAGIMYGVNFDPCNIAAAKIGVEDKDMEFSQFCGILLASFCYLCIYCMYKKNKPDIYVKSILPGFLSGLMWGVAQTGWFYANTNLGAVITFPIICCGPTIVSTIWGMTLYKEIKGRRNVVLVAILVTVMIAGSLCVAFSKKN